MACTAILFLARSRADEGMWIPLLLDKYNIEEMQAKGFTLTAEDIYSINKASMKDAIVIFGGGCTGELISGEGLLLTNHHCGYGRIQAHSSLENDYLTDGFWAMSGDEELPNPGLSVTLLVRMENVTQRVLHGADGLPAGQRDSLIMNRMARISAEAVAGTHYSAMVRPFYHGNQYFLFINEVFRDVRLVGAPPSAIGKFGGDTDNWMWPRHTGDFSLFRVYAGKDNMPADYSPDNVPYRPAKFFPVSLAGIQEGDFTMVFGYPGNTAQYVPAVHIKMLTGDLYPRLVEVREKKLDVMNDWMERDPLVRIQYSAKNAGVSNAWKRWIGELNGLAKLDAAERKSEFERQFSDWVGSDPVRKEKYGELLRRYDELYRQYTSYRVLRDYYNEVFFRQGVELLAIAGMFHPLVEQYAETPAPEAPEPYLEFLQNRLTGFFDDYHAPLDQELFPYLMSLFDKNVDDDFQPEYFRAKKTAFRKNFDEWGKSLFKKSWFDDPDKVDAFLTSFTRSSVKKVMKDPAYMLFKDAMDVYQNRIMPHYIRLEKEIGELDRLYMAAQMEFQPGKRFYPDANFTLRVSYGEVKGYTPLDAVYFKHYSTIEGIMEKDNPGSYDYRVPEKLRELYHNRDFGRYTQGDDLPVCFIATNHTTGGNSGSPVVNARGHLIGINFDRAWEGVSSDLVFNPGLSRNISLDIRFVLFIIDKFAGAGYLLEEMEVVE